MDELDINLLEAWAKVTLKCRLVPEQSRKRWRRVRYGMHRHPVRPWCLAVRASDTRITPWDVLFDDERAWERGEGHSVKLSGRKIRQLCAPVHIPWPGVPKVEAARLLGRDRAAMTKWIPVKAGRTKEERRRQQPRRFEEIRDPAYPFGVRYEPASCYGHPGNDVPVIWSDQPLDPGAERCQSPHAMWGSLWQTLWRRMPEEFAQELRREPHWVIRLGRVEQRGWDWICPGLAGRPCGRRVRSLYGPMPLWGIAQVMGFDEALELGEPGVNLEKLRMVGQWKPGWFDPWAGKRRLACERCWSVRRISMASYKGWNDFVTFLSGGLLYGRDVMRPAWIQLERINAAPKRRRRRQTEPPEATPVDAAPRFDACRAERK